MNNFNKIKSFLEKNPEMLVYPSDGPLSPFEIQYIEKELGVTIAGEYLQFLQTWRALSMASCAYEYWGVYEVKEYGIPKPDGKVWWVIEATLECRESGLDHKYIAIASDDEHVHLCLDPSIDGKQEVILWACFEKEHLGKHADSLFDAIWEDICENAITDPDLDIVLDLSGLDIDLSALDISE